MPVCAKHSKTLHISRHTDKYTHFLSSFSVKVTLRTLRFGYADKQIPVSRSCLLLTVSTSKKKNFASAHPAVTSPKM